MKELDGRAYLLSQATPGDAERLEERLMEADEAYETLLAIEDDLFDAYARGTLTAGERKAFEAKFGHQTERIAFAQALAQRVPRQQVVWSASRVGWLAAAAAVTLAVGVTWFARERNVTVVPPPAPTVATAAPDLKIPSVLAVVTLSTSRAAAETPAITLPAGRSELQLRVRLNVADRFDKYEMELRTSGDKVAWRGSDLKAAAEAGDLVVMGTIPSEALVAGVYELAVRGGASDLGFVTIKINRMP